MKKTREGFVTTAIVTVISLALLATAAHSIKYPTPTFERIKGLLGEWKGTDSDGNTVKVTYELVSNGTAVLERIESEMEMITVYHADGEDVMMTHFCAAGNQPRMRAKKDAKDMVKFAFVDATNLASKNDGHMRELVMKFPKDDQLTHEWTFHEGGKAKTVVFNFARVK